MDIYYSYAGISINGISYRPSAQEISIVENKLNMKAVFVFTSTTISNDKIFGSWKRENWYCGYSKQDSIHYYDGKYEEYYTFEIDSLNCQYRTKYLTGIFSPSEYSYTRDYTFQQSILNIPGFALRNLTVQFKYGKMLWYFDYPISELTRM
jgi:hypothetical protein